MSAEDIKEFYAKFKTDSGKVQQALPDMVKGFMSLFQATMKAGALTIREKELVALSVGIALRCDPCIYLHVQKCLEAGATREEILEVAAVVTMMQGGPGFTYTTKVYNALEALGK